MEILALFLVLNYVVVLAILVDYLLEDSYKNLFDYLLATLFFVVSPITIWLIFYYRYFKKDDT